MRFINYVDNVQQYMRVLQGKFVKLQRVYSELLHILKNIQYFEIDAHCN